MQFTHSYLELGERFYQKINPSPVSAPHILLWNSALAKQLLVSKGLNESRDEQAQVFSGNKVLDNSQPSALAYCGHQFGQLNPQLGDGRAHLLGELIDANGKRVDVQLKGSGPTQYSRNGDGRSALAPALREYIMSEAMYYLGVPTTRSLAVVATGDTVYRDTEKPGGITARIASSHIRVGTFVYFAVHKDFESLEKLLNYSIKRHYPAVAQSENKALGFLQAVMQAQL
ncbi:MAG: YdiU family protein, partial [Sinobacterium sp.]|nr:YdiU family protein [Sinobacterium sp.]